jgi:antirestriction protein
MPTTTDKPRIYVASLADYNNGVRHGEWIDADQDADGIQYEVNAMLRASKFPNVVVPCPDCGGEGVSLTTEDAFCKTCNGTGKVLSAEEWAIHDYGGFYGLKIGEYDSFSAISELAKLIADHGEAYALYADNVGIEWATEEDFQESYQGEAESEEAYASELFDETHTVPEELAMYIDYAAFARDLFLEGYNSQRGQDGTLHIFRDN